MVDFGKDVSSFTMSFGESFDTTDGMMASVHLNLSKYAADNMQVKVQAETEGKFDGKNQLVIGFKVPLGCQNEFIEVIDRIFNGEGGFFKPFRNLFDKEKLKYQTVVNEGRAWVSLALGDEFLEEFIVDTQAILAQGLGEIALQQENELKFKISSKNSFQDLITLRETPMYLSAALLDSLKVEIIATHYKAFGEKFGAFLNLISGSNDAKLLSLGIWSNIKVDVKFGSTSEIPTDLFKILKLKKIDADLSIPTADLEILVQLLNLIDQDIVVYGSIPDMLSLEAEFSVKSLSDYLVRFHKASPLNILA